MRKLLSLFINEWTKVVKKPSVIILSALILASGFALPGVMKGVNLLMKMANNSMNDTYDFDSWMKSEMQDSLAGYEASIAETSTEIERVRSSKEYSDEEKDWMLRSLEEQKAQTQDTLEIYTLAAEKEIYPDYQPTYLTQAVRNIIDLKSSIRTAEVLLKENPDGNGEQQLNKARDLVSGFLALLEKPDYSTYVSLETQRIDMDPYMAQDEKDTMKEMLVIRQRLQPEGGLEEDQTNSAHIESALGYITGVKQSVDSGIDYVNYSMFGTSTPMTPSEKAAMVEKEMVIDYRLENNLFPTKAIHEQRMSAIEFGYSAGMFLISILVIILAGSSISQEIATGSIKSLIIAPVRRWKIFAAKVLSLLSMAFAAFLILYVFGLLGQGVFYGFGDSLPYVYVSNGEITSIPYAVYIFLNLFGNFVEIIIFLFFAFMLSIVLRNTAVSVALSLGCLLTKSVAMGLINMMPNVEFLQFIPPMHFDLSSRIFTLSKLMTAKANDFSMSMFAGAGVTTPSVSFSLIYLAVISFLMLYTAFDSFTRRDLR